MELSELEALLEQLYKKKRSDKKEQFQRSVSFGDYFADRWERSDFEGFGAGTSVYDNVLILGDVKIGKNVWVGPGVVLDGRGGLEIGDFCSISAGVQIYTHNTVDWSLSLGKKEIVSRRTRIGRGVYIGPNSVIQMGTEIGERCVIGAMSFINRDIPSFSKVHGIPAKIVGKVEVEE